MPGRYGEPVGNTNEGSQHGQDDQHDDGTDGNTKFSHRYVCRSLPVYGQHGTVFGAGVHGNDEYTRLFWEGGVVTLFYEKLKEYRKENPRKDGQVELPVPTVNFADEVEYFEKLLKELDYERPAGL